MSSEDIRTETAETPASESEVVATTGADSDEPATAGDRAQVSR